MRPARNHSNWLDGLAISASALCLIHCLALPLLFALLPVSAALAPSPESIHLAAIIFAVPLSSVALIAGFRRRRLIFPLLSGASGIALLIAGLVAAQNGSLETLFTVAGSLAIAIAHLFNWMVRS